MFRVPRFPTISFLSPALASGSGSAAGAAGKAQVGLKRGAWTSEEDEVLSSYIRREGEGKWRTLPKRAGLLRCGKSCRLRWMNYLRPSVKRGPIAPDEEELILRMHRLLGNRWSLIAGRLPGRTDNEIKNYWNSHLSKKLISQGIDPRTHKPLNANKPSSSFGRDNDHASPVPAANPNPSTVQIQNTSFSLGHPDVHTNSSMVVSEDVDNYSDGYNLDDGGDQWQTLDGTKATGLTNSHVTAGDAVEIGGMGCCTDDGFSSFLDSLINDDMFQKNPEYNSNVCDATLDIDLAAASDFLVSEDLAFGNQPLWEPAVICSTTSDEENHGVRSAGLLKRKKVLLHSPRRKEGFHRQS